MKKIIIMFLFAAMLVSLAGCGADTPQNPVQGVTPADTGNNEQKQPDSKDNDAYTPQDVMAGGSYVVVLGDYMNSITLYYENGVLVKLVEDFQKSYEEETSAVTYEGEALEEYGFNFIDWSDAPLQDILDGMADYGGYDQYTIRKAD